MHILRKIYLALLFSAVFYGFAFSQQYNYKIYLAKHGLANSIVNHIFQDSRGYIWFATQGGGVSRFDGRKFKTFTNKEGLAGNDVLYTVEDNNGNLWFATNGNGVSRYDGIKFSSFGEKQGVGSVVYSIFKDEKGKLWFSNYGSGISVFQDEKFTTISKKDGLPTDSVFCVQEEANGSYLIGTYGKGLYRYDGKTFTQIKNANGDIVHKSVFRITKRRDGTFLIGSARNNGVSSFDGKKLTPLQLPAEINKDIIGDMVEDDYENIWIATEHGLIKYNDKTGYKIFNEKEGLSTSQILSLAIDYEGNLWIGTFAGGVVLFKGESFVNFSKSDGLNSNKVTTVLQDSEGSYLFGTQDGGLNVFYKNQFHDFSSIAELKNYSIQTILEDKNKRIWVGTDGAGIFIFKNKGEGNYEFEKKITKFAGIKALPGVAKIIEDTSGKIWIATYGNGVLLIDEKGNESVFNSQNSPVADNVLTLFEDSKKALWIGTYQGGLVKYDGREFRVFDQKNGLSDISVLSVAEDKKGTIYFGTYESGLNVYDGTGTFKNFTVADGLCSDRINSLIADSSGYVWVGTNKGINRIRFSDSNNILSLKYYGEIEGFKGIEVVEGTFFIDQEQHLWIGSVNGVTKYSSEFDRRNTTPPKIILTGVRLDYQVVDWGKTYKQNVDPKTKLPLSLELPHNNKNLTFDFQALTTDKVKYTYMLEGLADQWSPLTENPEAPFPSIPPGSYVFKVKGQNSDGIWSQDTLVFSFTILPPFYLTGWFFTACAIVIILSVLGFIRWRTAKLATEKKVLEEKVTERTLELADANDQLSVAYRDITDSIQYAKKIQESILPLDEDIQRELPESFVLFKPRDVVSGDFYWFNEKDEKLFFAAVDCTGHGVPGAFMSMIGNTLLNEIVNEIEAADPAVILNHLNQGVRKSLKQDREAVESKDGMDIAICVIDKKKRIVKFAGAKRPLYFFRNDKESQEFSEIRADRMSIGGLQMTQQTEFTSHSISAQKGDTFYIFTDGFVDQFGGEKGKKFSSKRLQQAVSGMQSLSMARQKEELHTVFEQWKGKIEQVDDVLLIGIRM